MSATITTPSATVNGLRLAALHDRITATDLNDALRRVRAVLNTTPRDDDAFGCALDAFLVAIAQRDGYDAVLDAAGEESGIMRWPDGRAISGGDLGNAYAEPALIFGVALGLCIAGRTGGVR